MSFAFFSAVFYFTSNGSVDFSFLSCSYAVAFASNYAKVPGLAEAEGCSRGWRWQVHEHRGSSVGVGFEARFKWATTHDFKYRVSFNFAPSSFCPPLPWLVRRKDWLASLGDCRSVLGETYAATPQVLPIRGHLDDIKRMLVGDYYIGRGSRQRDWKGVCTATTTRSPSTVGQRRYVSSSANLRRTIICRSGCGHSRV